MINIANYGIEDTRKMSEKKIQMEIGKISNEFVWELGIDSKEAGRIICTIMNLGIALQEKFDERKANKDGR